MRTLSQIYSDSDTETFALGSSQYAGIYEYYRDFKMFGEAEKVDSLTNELKYFLEETVQDVGSMITEEAKQWEETPSLEEWNSLELKVKLMKAKNEDTKDITRKVFRELFELLKNQSWDLWTALNLCSRRYAELHEYTNDNSSPVAPEGDKHLGLMIYFFSEKLNLNDREVREIFGGFDT